MKEILMRGGVMDTVRSLEKTVAEWYKNVPHLPLELRKWLGNNIWWIVLIGVVLTVMALFPIFLGLLIVAGISGAAIGASTTYGALAGGIAGTALIAAVVTIIGLLVTAVVMGLAIGPLKQKQKKGWTLLFIVLLVSTAFGVLGNLVTLSIFGAVWALLWAAVEGYILFEIRGEFGVKAASKPVAGKTVKA